MQKVRRKIENLELAPLENLLDGSGSFPVGEIKQKDYQNNGLFPVIDQSTEYVAGYSDEKSKVYKGPLPVIIFGDHTRVIKFIDFPFVVGGSGVKIMVTNQNVLPKYLYYSLLNTNIESKGYNRHYGLLKEKNFLVLPLLEQQKIVEVLDTAQEAVEMQDKLIEKTQELKRTTMHKLFTEGTRGEKQKKTKIGKIPEDWEILMYKDLVDVNAKYSIGELKQKDFKDDSDDLYPIVDQSTNGNLIVGYSDQEEKLYDGPLPIIIFGDHTRAVKLVDFRFISGGSGVKIVIPKKEVELGFLYYLTKNIDIPSKGYNRHYKLLKESFIPFTKNVKEQKEISHILQTIDEKIEIHKKKKEKYEELFRSLLHKLMGGKVNTSNI